MHVQFKSAAAIIGVVGAALAATPAEAAEYGGCRFNSQTHRFAGTVAETTACLLKKVNPGGNGAVSQPVPQWLLERVAKPVSFTAARLSAYLAARSISAADLGGAVAIGNTPARRYFVIHDTSWPEIPGTSASAFPANIDSPAYSGNNLTGWGDLSEKVNLIISRDGRSRTFRDWSAVRPKAAIKIESPSRVPAAKTVFVHVENIQPRVDPPSVYAWIAPTPGFSAAQEQRLALAYVMASARAGRWLIPAYHFNIDQGLPQGHDDPQNTDLASWVGKVAEIEAALIGP